MKDLCLSRSRYVMVLGVVAAALVLSSCKSDLVARNIHYEPLTGPNLVMKSEIKNQGMKAADQSITKLEITYDWSDPFVEKANMTTTPLNRGQSIEMMLWPFSPTELVQPGGCLHVRVCADAGQVVEETIESNNCRTRSFSNQKYCLACDSCCNQHLPQIFDWRNSNGTNWVTPIRDQASCGSCWAFSAIAAIEAKNNVQRDPDDLSPIDLSEQQLVSCPGAGGDCLGGWSQSAMAYVQSEGVVAENTFGYNSMNCTVGTNTGLDCVAPCIFPVGCGNPILTQVECEALDEPSSPGGLNPPSWWIESHHRVVGNSVDAVKRAVLCHGPLSVGSSQWRHAILLVGWTPNSWIIKNSWGTGWGSNGYGLIPFSGHIYSDIKDRAWYVQGVKRRR